MPSSHAPRTRGPVPGTVEIASEHEIDTSAAVPGTDMEIGIRGLQPAGGSGCGRGRVRRPCPILYAGLEALRPPAGDGWSPRPPAASNLGERVRERATLKSTCRIERAHQLWGGGYPELYSVFGTRMPGMSNRSAITVIALGSSGQACSHRPQPVQAPDPINGLPPMIMIARSG